MKLENGNQAPDFTVKSCTNEELTLSTLRGQNVVLFFYPKDDTPGCTIEANEFTALTNEFAQADTLVFGVSRDGCDEHLKFTAKYDLKVELLADTDGQVCEKYHTWGEQQYMGKKYMGIARSTFVIDKTGKLVEALYKVKAKGHAQQILERVQELD